MQLLLWQALTSSADKYCDIYVLVLVASPCSFKLLQFHWALIRDMISTKLMVCKFVIGLSSKIENALFSPHVNIKAFLHVTQINLNTNVIIAFCDSDVLMVLIHVTTVPSPCQYFYNSVSVQVIQQDSTSAVALRNSITIRHTARQEYCVRKKLAIRSSPWWSCLRGSPSNERWVAHGKFAAVYSVFSVNDCEWLVLITIKRSHDPQKKTLYSQRYRILCCFFCASAVLFALVQCSIGAVVCHS